MDTKRFDELTKCLAGAKVTRVAALRAAAGAGLGAVLGLRNAGGDAEAKGTKQKNSGRVAAQAQGPCGKNNSFLCHKEAVGPPNNTQCIQNSAVSAHLAHGDCFCGETGCLCPTQSPGTECFIGASGSPTGSPTGSLTGEPLPAGVPCPPDYTGNARSRCNDSNCPCLAGRQCKNGLCCEKKGTHCSTGKECCSGTCKRIHSNHKQCA